VHVIPQFRLLIPQQLEQRWNEVSVKNAESILNLIEVHDTLRTGRDTLVFQGGVQI
jgi:hypothetical protein